jgi:metal-responsive CopG/Arc/MetJ family transcriptional regulator
MTNDPKPSARSPSNIKRMTISLNDETAEMLDYLATSQGISQNEALRRAIATERYLKEELQGGNRILVQKSNNEIRELVFR